MRGSGGISQVAFSRGLSSGGNLDKRAYVDLGKQGSPGRSTALLGCMCCEDGNPTADLQNYWTTLYFNAEVNYDTWYEHHTGYLPHIKLCGRAAVRRDDLRRFHLREQPVGTWLGEIPPWTTLAKRERTRKISIDH
eukprot:8598945-Pyramimonas_sp.AAC.1